MELTLNIPEQLNFRLRPHQDRLDKIIELGLDALEAGDKIAAEAPAEDAVGGPIPPDWLAASNSLARRWQAECTLPRPRQEELEAYLRGELDDEAAEALRERLMGHPEAIEDLLVLDATQLDATQLGATPLDEAQLSEELREAPSDGLQDGQPSVSAADAISDTEIRQAWQDLKLRMASRRAADSAPGNGPEEANTAAAERPTADVLPMPPRPARRPSPTRNWLYLVAGLLLTTGGFAASTAYHSQQPVTAYITSRIELNTSRGPRPFQLDAGADHVLLLVSLPAPVTVGDQPPVLVITGPGGATVYRRAIEGNDGGGTLHLALPRYKLPPGDYRLEVLQDTGGQAAPLVIREFAIESS